MKDQIITITQLHICLPIKIKHIKDLEIIEKINEHAIANIICIIEEQEELFPLYELTIENMVKIEYTIEKAKEILFCGYPIKIDIQVIDGIYELSLKLASATINMDFQKKSRSFQNKDNLNSKLIKDIIQKDYNGNCFFNVQESRQNKIFIQYNETDWEFIKRVASQWRFPVFCSSKSIKPFICIGVPNGEQYEEKYINYSIENDIASYLSDSFNIESCISSHYINYEIDIESNYELGDRIKYNKIEFVIFEKTVYLEKSILRFKYKIKLEKAIRQNRILPFALQGKSFKGEVIAQEKDKLKVHLFIDKEQSIMQANWFSFNTTYAAENNVGLYVMPQIGNIVSLYIPDTDEDHAYIRYVNRTDGSLNPKTKNSEQKYFGTINNQEIMFSSAEIKFSTSLESVSLSMKQEKGIDTRTKSNIKIKGKEIDISGKTVTLSAKQELLIETQNTNIIIDKIVHIKGDTEVII